MLLEKEGMIQLGLIHEQFPKVLPMENPMNPKALLPVLARQWATLNFDVSLSGNVNSLINESFVSLFLKDHRYSSEDTMQTDLLELASTYQQIPIFAKMSPKEFEAMEFTDQVHILRTITEQTNMMRDVWTTASSAYIAHVIDSRDDWQGVLPIELLVPEGYEFARESNEAKDFPLLPLLAHFLYLENLTKLDGLAESLRISIRNTFIQNPTVAREMLTLLYQQDPLFPSEVIDRILGISQRYIQPKELKQRYGDQQFDYEGTPYGMIQKLLENLSPSDKEIVWDLGCGHGRILFYGALTTPALYKGVEIVEERVANIKRIQQNLALDRVEVTQGNVLDTNFSDGTIFFLFNPFNIDTLEEVIKKLHLIAQDHPITIASWGRSNIFFELEDWLEELPQLDVMIEGYQHDTQFDPAEKLRIFRSKPIFEA